ncbi:hypothetical protein P885DRAFT_40681, partial [Corynascus similis CBS 632.67]
IRPSALQIDANTPCVLKMHIPITLPHQLDPSVPAPPYHPGILGGEALLNLYVMPVLRRLMAEIVSRLFGPEHAADALRASNWALPTPGARHLRLIGDFDSSLVVDKENGFNLAAGYYKDQYGVEGHGPIYAYEEEVKGHIVILHGFVLSLVCGVRDARKLVEINPGVLRFDLVGEEEGCGALGHELVFDVKEYTETFRRHYVNDDLVIPMRNGDSFATPRQRL